MRIVRIVPLLVMPMTAVLPTMAQNDPPPPSATPAPALDLMDEIIVQGYRYTEPSFQEQVDYHRQEYEKLHKKYGPPAVPPCLFEFPSSGPKKPGTGIGIGCPSDKSNPNVTLVIRF